MKISNANHICLDTFCGTLCQAEARATLPLFFFFAVCLRSNLYTFHWRHAARLKGKSRWCSTRFGITTTTPSTLSKLTLSSCCFVFCCFFWMKSYKENKILTLEVQLINQTTPTCWGWSILDQGFFTIPWKSLATIFYGLVSEPPCFKCKGLTWSKRNHQLLEKCLTSQILLEISPPTIPVVWIHESLEILQ